MRNISGKIRGRYLLIIVASCLLALCAVLSISCLNLFLVPVSKELGLDRGIFSITNSIISLMGIFMAPIWGQIIGKFRVKNLS